VPRAHRAIVPGDIVHIVARGVLQRAIYRDDRDRRHFTRLLDAAVTEHGWRCLTYCLMPNHFHLVVQLREATLSDGMHALNGGYARWHNERHQRVGHLFEGRYWSTVVRREEHMIGLARYVAVNPVRAHLCADAAQWRWSAHRALIGDEPAGFVDAPAMLVHFDEDLVRARQRYAAAVGAAEPSSRPAADPRLLELLAWPDVDRAVAYAHHELGYGIEEIARALDCTRLTVRRRLDRAARVQKGPAGSKGPDAFG
jgi:REP element-mobilizing transposase RayT